MFSDTVTCLAKKDSTASVYCDVCIVMYVLWCMYCDVCIVMYVLWCMYCDVCIVMYVLW
jgi:hypothetical protein